MTLPLSGKELYRLVQVWEQSTLSERYAGALYWFRLHNALQQRVDEHRECCRHTLPQVAAAFAVMSPNNTFKANVRALDAILDYWHNDGTTAGLDQVKVSCYGRDKLRAWLALKAHNSPDTTLSGQKVRSFYFNLMDPNNEDGIVTVDGHMANMARGEKSRLNKVKNIGKREYSHLEAMVQQAAGQVGVRPSHFQAVVWLAWKRIHGIAHDPQEVLFL